MLFFWLNSADLTALLISFAKKAMLLSCEDAKLCEVAAKLRTEDEILIAGQIINLTISLPGCARSGRNRLPSCDACQLADSAQAGAKYA